LLPQRRPISHRFHLLILRPASRQRRLPQHLPIRRLCICHPVHPFATHPL
jgi:hypothetical protein